MSATAKEFTPREGETEIHLQQIGAEQVSNASSDILSVKVPSDEIDVLIGLLDGIPHAGMDNLYAMVIVLSCAIFIAALAGLVCWFIGVRNIDISQVLSEADGKASLSRFQALLFSFVFAAGCLAIIIETGAFPQDIPMEVIAILGGSLTTYLVSKGIQRGKDGAMTAELMHAQKDNSGPMAHYAGDKAFETAIIGAEGAGTPRESAVNLSASEESGPVPVAVAVGQCTFDLDVVTSGAAIDTQKVTYTNAAGARIVEDLSPGQNIITAPGKVTEVQVLLRTLKGTARAQVTIKRT